LSYRACSEMVAR